MRINWTENEDQLCIAAVYNILREKNWLQEYKTTQKLFVGLKWKDVAKKVNTRNAKQCRERYVNQLSPYINKRSGLEKKTSCCLICILT